MRLVLNYLQETSVGNIVSFQSTILVFVAQLEIKDFQV